MLFSEFLMQKSAFQKVFNFSASGGGWTFSQNFSSLAFTVMDWKCLEDSKQKDDSLN